MMYKLLKNLFVLFCAVVFFGSCRKQAFEDYYGRPDNLQPPIYQVLSGKGNFTTLLAVIDKSGYKNTLSAAGYWTFFAPNDEAFKKYFSENNTTLAAIDSTTARKLVTYCLIFNAFQTNHIADFQAPTGWVANNAYKRRTAYYDGFYTGAGPDGPNTVLLSANRNSGQFIFGDNNNKYIPYFYSSYMTSKNLGAADYNYFFPNSTYTGFNVVDAQVVNKDIIAENGVIHEIDRVILALPSLEQKIAGNSQYSEFKKLFDQFMVTYLLNNDATTRYNILTGSSSKAYIKQYSNLLAFAPGNENYIKLTDNDGQTDGYSVFAPNNAAFTKYLNEVILEFYGTIERLPITVISDLLNAHLFSTTVWPTKFATTNNFLNEPARINASTNVVEKQFCSNGVFYGTNAVQQANVFSTVYSRAYLDPAYSFMWRILSGLKTTISNPGLQYTIFMVPDATFKTLGFDYNTATSAFTYSLNGGTPAAGGTQMQRLVNQLIVSTPNKELNNLGGQGIIETNGGEYIKWNNNTVFAAGNLELNPQQFVGVNGSRDYVNGRVYYLPSGTLLYPTGTVAAQIARNATTVTSPYYDFYQYLINSTAYSTVALEISGFISGANYTIFVPTKAAIQQAVRDGFLPGTVAGAVVTPNYNPASLDDKAKVARFIQFHILNGVTIATDGVKGATGSGFPTFLANSLGDKLELNIVNQPNNLKVTDNQGRTATVINGANSNYLGTRTLIHQIDNYLRYNF